MQRLTELGHEVIATDMHAYEQGLRKSLAVIVNDRRFASLLTPMSGRTECLHLNRSTSLPGQVVTGDRSFLDDRPWKRLLVSQILLTIDTRCPLGPCYEAD